MLKLPRAQYDALRRHGEESYPHECCGALLGKMQGGTRVVHEVMVCNNARQDAPHNRYGISPAELVAAQKRARELGLDLIGFYHSHPDSPARWSQQDLQEAHWFACSYVITSVEGGTASRTISYVLAGTDDDDKRLDDETIELLD